MLHDKGIRKELLIGSTLVDVYAKYSLLVEVQHVSLKLTSKDVVLWNLLISGFIECGDVEKVIYCIENATRRCFSRHYTISLQLEIIQ